MGGDETVVIGVHAARESLHLLRQLPVNADFPIAVFVILHQIDGAAPLALSVAGFPSAALGRSLLRRWPALCIGLSRLGGLGLGGIIRFRFVGRVSGILGTTVWRDGRFALLSLIDDRHRVQDHAVSFTDPLADLDEFVVGRSQFQDPPLDAALDAHVAPTLIFDLNDRLHGYAEDVLEPLHMDFNHGGHSRLEAFHLFINRHDRLIDLDVGTHPPTLIGQYGHRLDRTLVPSVRKRVDRNRGP